MGLQTGAGTGAGLNGLYVFVNRSHKIFRLIFEHFLK